MAAEREQLPSQARFVYVTRFGSHRCGSVLYWSGRRAHRCPQPRAGRGQKEPWEGALDGEEMGPAAGPRVPTASASPQPRTSRAQSGPRPAPCADSVLKKAAKEYDFPIPLNETSKIMKRKKKKKLAVWDGVYKVISRMLEENEKYRLRLKSQRLSSESKLTQF
ncbi:uncharacterized protein C5orf47 homolog [Rhynchocyon petersi]